MSAFDVAVGVDGPTMNQAGAAVYQQLYPQPSNPFKGCQTVNKDGLEFQVAWDVKQAPQFILAAPDRAAAMLRAHLAQADPPAGRSPADMVAALTESLTDSIFQMVLPDVQLTVTGAGGPGVDQVAVTIVVQASSVGGKMSLVPLKATGTTSNPSDQWFINNVLLPQAMQMANTLLSGVDLPPLSFSGLQLTPPVMIVAQQHVVALANLSGKAVPQPPFPDSWPNDAFFALLSDEARMAVARAGTASIIGKPIGQNGSVDIGIGTAYYTATATINSIQLDLAGGNQYHFNAVVTGNVAVGIKVGCTNIGVNYTLYAKPDPDGYIALYVNGTMVNAVTLDVSTVVLFVTPNGNPVEWILSALTVPLLNTLTLAFAPLITQELKGISFEVFQLKPIPIQIQTVHLTVTPTNVQFASFENMMSVVGSASITS